MLFVRLHPANQIMLSWTRITLRTLVLPKMFGQSDAWLASVASPGNDCFPSVVLLIHNLM
jgi:hypothetical protein